MPCFGAFSICQLTATACPCSGDVGVGIQDNLRTQLKNHTPVVVDVDEADAYLQVVPSPQRLRRSAWQRCAFSLRVPVHLAANSAGFTGCRI